MRQKISAAAVLLVIFFQFWPQRQGGAQKVADSILSEQNQELIKMRDAMLDSIKSTTDRVHEKQNKITSKSGVRQKRQSKSKEVKIVIQKVIIRDTVAVTRYKYIPSYGPVDKSDYWQEQRRWTDSIAQIRKDSIAWRHRSLIKKIFGGKKR